MGSERNKNSCTVCLSSVISMGLTGLFLWLGLRTQKPKCSIESLFIPSLTATSHHHQNASVVFQLNLANPNGDKGVRYDVVNLSFTLFLTANTTRPLANATLLGFSQGHGKTAKKWGSAEARGGGVNRTAAAVDGKVFVRVEFATTVKYKMFLFFYTKRHRLDGGANVEMNVSTGEKVSPEGIRLGAEPPVIVSKAAQVRRCCAASVRVFVTVLILVAFT